MTKTQAQYLARVLRAQVKQSGRKIAISIGSKLYGAGWTASPRGLKRQMHPVFFVRYGSRITFEQAHPHHPLLNKTSRGIEAFRMAQRERRSTISY